MNRHRSTSYVLPTLLAAAVILLQCLALTAHVPAEKLVGAVLQPDPTAFGEIYVRYSLLPRMVVALLAGAALGLAGAVFQQVLKNPLAEPSTLGILSGAQLGIILASLGLPVLAGWQQEAAGLGGALLALALVMLLASRGGFSPTTLLISGMVVSFSASAVSVVAGLLHQEYLRSVFLWSSGSLLQNDFSVAWQLLLRLLLLVPPLLLLIRPMMLSALDDRSALSLGLSLATVRLVALGLASALSASVVSQVGVIAFIGLAAPHLAALTGARTLGHRLALAPVFGALLLLFSDGLVLLLSRSIAEIPTGTLTALCGGMLLLVMLRQKAPADPPGTEHGIKAARRSQRRYGMLLALALLAVLTAASLTETFGLHTLNAADLLGGRWPRILTAAAAGAMLAMAGCALQAMTGNPLASPEGIGVSAGAALGIVAAFFLGGLASPVAPLVGGIAGASVALAIISLITARSGHATSIVLLAGVGLGTLSSAILSLVMASGDPRAAYVLAWSMGPTFRATPITALVAVIFAVLSIGVAPFFARWLTIMPLGSSTGTALGMPLRGSRALILAFVAILSAVSTLVIGPLSFVGLMAPHIAASLCRARPFARMMTAAAIGAALMIAADWLGRSIAFPYEIPAGTLSAFVGGPYFLWSLGRKRS
jgi:ferric hydroxamate transport system permease protein